VSARTSIQSALVSLTGFASSSPRSKEGCA
jgi:hypothetical protein